MEILNYEDKYHKDFKDLSYEWLEKYVSVEPEDEKILNNPREIILDKGGYIYLAKYKDEIVGTISLIKIDATSFELAKLAITENYKSLGIGSHLMEKVITTAKESGAKKIILYTNHNLLAALRLYEKFGFKDVPLVDNKYIESDLKMELYL